MCGAGLKVIQKRVSHYTFRCMRMSTQREPFVFLSFFGGREKSILRNYGQFARHFFYLERGSQIRVARNFSFLNGYFLNFCLLFSPPRYTTFSFSFFSAHSLPSHGTRQPFLFFFSSFTRRKIFALLCRKTRAKFLSFSSVRANLVGLVRAQRLPFSHGKP